MKLGKFYHFKESRKLEDGSFLPASRFQLPTINKKNAEIYPLRLSAGQAVRSINITTITI